MRSITRRQAVLVILGVGLLVGIYLVLRGLGFIATALVVDPECRNGTKVVYQGSNWYPIGTLPIELQHAGRIDGTVTKTSDESAIFESARIVVALRQQDVRNAHCELWAPLPAS